MQTLKTFKEFLELAEAPTLDPEAARVKRQQTDARKAALVFKIKKSQEKLTKVRENE